MYSIGPKLASLAVQHKASKGYVTELAVILTSLCLVQVSFYFHKKYPFPALQY